ncbi:hypothetical protein RIEGSTA812A_PEG_1150 [invertebrate metagenome]|uniref:Zinc finger/thioredoxin putative domain-containing protein n=1 Tax=invertebrate metagenome TaxID=1711999 RepID=A0A484H6C1_9ZZZZ
MQVACPGCRSRFAVADHLLSPTGRKVKCMKCGAVWHEANWKRVRRKQSERESAGTAPPPVCKPVCTVEITGTSRPHQEAAEHDGTIWRDRTLHEERETTERVATTHRDDDGNSTPADPTKASSPTWFGEDNSTNSAHLSDVAPRQAGTGGEADLIPSVFTNSFSDIKDRGQKRPSKLIISIVVGMIALTAGAGGAWYGHTQMFEWWWPVLRGHLVDIGLPVIDLFSSLEFSDITALMTIEEGIQVLVVSGIVRNAAPAAIHMPSLRILFRDENRRVVCEREATDFSVPLLRPGEKAGFVLHLHNPPAGTTFDIGIDRK